MALCLRTVAQKCRLFGRSTRRCFLSGHFSGPGHPRRRPGSAGQGRRQSQISAPAPNPGDTGGDEPSSSAVQLTGFGFGHGHGMGQWGAYGYATVYGWDYQQILAHYYGGTRLGTMPAPEPDVTVHLTEFDGHNAIASALGGGQLVATWPGGATLSAPAFEVARSGGEETVSSGPGCDGPWQAVATTASTVTIGSSARSSSPATLEQPSYVERLQLRRAALARPAARARTAPARRTRPGSRRRSCEPACRAPAPGVPGLARRGA